MVVIAFFLGIIAGNVVVALLRPPRLTPDSCPYEPTHTDVPNVDGEGAGPRGG